MSTPRSGARTGPAMTGGHRYGQFMNGTHRNPGFRPEACGLVAHVHLLAGMLALGLADRALDERGHAACELTEADQAPLERKVAQALSRRHGAIGQLGVVRMREVDEAPLVAEVQL